MKNNYIITKPQLSQVLNKISAGASLVITEKKSMRKFLMQAFMVVACFASITLNAQTPTYFKSGTGTTGNTIPMGQASQKTQLLYPTGSFKYCPYLR